MDVLASWSAATLIHVGVLETLGTIILCYVLAVVNGHVSLWLPMISDCAVFPPEKYPFRLGVVLGASLLAVQAVTKYYADKTQPYSKLCAVLGVVASTGLAVVGVVNEKENGNIHDIAAITLFVCYDVYAIIFLHSSWNRKEVSRISYTIKFCSAVLGTVGFVGYITAKYFQDWGSIILALFEWSNTLTIMVFLWSFVLDDMANIKLSEIREATFSIKQKNKPVIISMNGSSELKPMSSLHCSVVLLFNLLMVFIYAARVLRATPFFTLAEMDILSKIRAPVLIHTAVLVNLGTILLCYVLAVVNGHVSPWLPMISDCAVLAPEKYPFRLGMVLGASLLEVVTILTYFADIGFSKNKLCFILGTLASASISITAVVNEKENNTIHSGGAVIFFFAYEIYMIIMAWYSIGEDRVSLSSIIIKMLCAIIGGLALAVFVFMSFNWGKYQLYIAICEWIGTFVILGFQWTHASDLSHVVIGEIKDTTCETPEYTGKQKLMKM